MGFVHAQDRLWQMEMRRRTGAGRLSEIFGARTIKIDRFMRVLGIYRAAEANLNELDRETQMAFEAYADGVNAYLATRSGALPPEFILLNIAPEPWTAADSLVWVKMMAWDLAGNWRDELLRARLARKLPPDFIAELWPSYPPDGPASPADMTDLLDGLPLEALAEGIPPAPFGALGSNNWAVAGSLTASGAPLLANDPHLSLDAPSQWYLAHLSGPGLEVIGATLPGLPVPVLGRTDRIAWGFTNTNPDVQDLFVERLDPDDPRRYLTPDGSKEFRRHEETILVRGAEPMVLEVRESRHGPIISDAVEGHAELLEEDRVLALAWTALRPDDLTAQAGRALIHARNWDEFSDALRDFHTPQQNIVYADIEGTIGFYAAGRVPIRRAGRGAMPAPGWDGSHDWMGFIPFEALPHAVDPPGGRLVTANHRIVGEDYPYFITDDWAPPYRYRRIQTLLDAQDNLSHEHFAKLQDDAYSEMAAELLPLMVERVERGSQAIDQALERLEAWDFTMARDRPEPLIFAAWQRALVRAIFADELEDAFDAFWHLRPVLLRRVLTEEGRWCDEVSTTERESCRDQTTRALAEALAELAESQGEDITRWRWGEAHYARLVPTVLGRLPVIGGLIDVRLPTDGGQFTVNVAGFEPADPLHPFVQRTAPGYRAIYDLGTLDRSLFIQNLGQSGNPFSPHFRNLAQRWHEGGYLPMVAERGAIEAAARLVLRPE
jgi:penicillin amidase